MTLQPAGFTRYRGKADTLLALVNSVMVGHNLLPTPKHTFYSLWHTFEDRLMAVEARKRW